MVGAPTMQYQPSPGLQCPTGPGSPETWLWGTRTFPEGQESWKPGPVPAYSRPGRSSQTAASSTATVRAADGMIYSTINTPIAATLPITTQPAQSCGPWCVAACTGLTHPWSRS